MEKRILRPLGWAIAALAALLVLAVVCLGVVMTRHRHRIEKVKERVERTHRLESFTLSLQEALLESRPDDTVTPRRAEALHAEIRQILLLGAGDDPETVGRLDQVREILTGLERQPGESLAASLDLLRDVVEAERTALLDLLTGIERTNRAELVAGAGLCFVLLVLAAWGGVFFHRRVADPLQDLALLFSRLGGGEFVRLEERPDPLLGPLFRNFNFLVERLEEHDRLQQQTAERLEHEVARASAALLEQHRSLALADRLAAVGEVAASLAHELRNPLAGVSTTLSNLENEDDDPERRERLRRVRGELGRMSRVLERLLDLAHHTPEPPRWLHLATLLDELMTFARYQLPKGVGVSGDVDPADLDVLLPEDRLRQALLNLVLNAVQAIGEGSGEVRIEARRGEDGRLTIAVLDDGPGLPEDLLEHGVRPFVSSRAEGTGLGLAMVRRFAKDLEGELRLANRSPRGARVALVFPAETAPHGEAR